MLKQYAFGALLILIISLSGYGWFEHNRYVTTKLEYDGFVSKAQAIAAQQLSNNERKEKEYANKLHIAESARLDAFNKLREYQARPRGERLPGSPQTSGNADTVCWSIERFDLGLRELEEIIIAGQKALIINKEALEAWPQ